MKNQSGQILSLSPELWAGAQTPFDKAFNDAFHKLVSVNAWDGMSKTRWFPISYLPFVKQLIREHALTSDTALDRASTLIQSELDRRVAIKRATDADGNVNGQLAADYAELGLHPSAHRTLVEWAIIFWRKELGTLGAPTTRLLQLEECYRRICSGGTA